MLISVEQISVEHYFTNYADPSCITSRPYDAKQNVGDLSLSQTKTTLDIHWFETIR